MKRFLATIKRQFREKWVIGHDHEHYLPPQSHWRRKDQSAPEELVFREPAPATQGPAAIPRAEPETIFDTQHWKRKSIKTSQYRPEEAAARAQVDGMLPRHIPQPAWYYDMEALKFMRRVYLESGVMPAGYRHKMKPYYAVDLLDRNSEWKPNQKDPNHPELANQQNAYSNS